MIKGLSDKRRLPRMGKIRLGIMVQSDKGCRCVKKNTPDPKCDMCRGTGRTFRSKEVDYFVCPDIVKKQYGAEPKELIIVFPTENEQVFFQQFYMKYGYGGLQCKGDGEFGTFFDFDKMEFVIDKKCPCGDLENKKCKGVGRLQFMLPEVEEAAGVWQIDTTSKNSIMDINSGIDYIRGICGRISMIPIKLVRSEIETQHPDEKEKKMKRGTHWTMKFSLEGVTLKTLQRYGQTDPQTFFLPEPDPNRPEDLFPQNGDQEEEQTGEKETGVSEGGSEVVPQTEAEKPEKVMFITLSNGNRKKETRKMILERFEVLRDSLVTPDPSAFVQVLGDNGFTTTDEIPDKDLNKIYGELLTKWRETE